MKYQAKSWDKPRRVISKIEWHPGELFPRCYFIMINSRLPAFPVVKVYIGLGDVENRIKGGKHAALGQDKLQPVRGERSLVENGFSHL
jgi:hypothetical protein